MDFDRTVRVADRLVATNLGHPVVYLSEDGDRIAVNAVRQDDYEFIGDDGVVGVKEVVFHLLSPEVENPKRGDTIRDRYGDLYEVIRRMGSDGHMITLEVAPQSA